LWDTDDIQHHAATAALERHLVDGNRLIVPVTALSEVLVGAFRATPYAVRTVERFVDDLIGEVRPADRAIGRAAARLPAHHPPPRSRWPTPCCSRPARWSARRKSSPQTSGWNSWTGGSGY